MKNNKGTTLLELMVSVAIFSSIMLVVTGVFANVNTAQREVIASQNIQESVRFFVEMASKEIRMAQGNKDGTAIDCPVGYFVTDNKTFNTNATSSMLFFRNKDDECVSYFESGGRININRDGVILPITPGNIVVSNLQFVIDDDSATVIRTKQTKVTIFFDVESKIDIEMHKNKTKMQTTISSRRYE